MLKALTLRCPSVCIIIYCSLALPQLLFAAAEDVKLTLSSAIKQTLAQSPQLHQFEFSRQRIVADREVSTLKPVYTLAIEVENFAGSGDISGADQTEVTVALSSVLELGGKRQARKSVADAKLNELDYRRQAETLDLLCSLTRAFILSLTSQEELKLAVESSALSAALVHAVSERAKRGAASDIEVLRARALLTQSQIRENHLRARLERRHVALASYWGSMTPNFKAVEGDLFVFAPNPSFAALYKRVEQSPTLQALASEIDLKEAELRFAKAHNRGNVEWQLGAKHFEDSGDSALVVGVSVPLFSAMRNRGAVKMALADRGAVDGQRDMVLLALHEQLFNAHSQREQYIATTRQLKQQVIPDLASVLNLTRDAYDRGRLKYQDWIAAQQELQNAKQQLIESASAVLLNQALLEQLTAQPLQQ